MSIMRSFVRKKTNQIPNKVQILNLSTCGVSPEQTVQTCHVTCDTTELEQFEQLL